MSAPLAANIGYTPFSIASGTLELQEGNNLGAICFPGRKLAGATGTPCIRVDAPLLDGQQPSSEIWLSSGGIVSRQCGAINYRCDGDLLFGAIELPETAQSLAETATPLQQATESAYRQIFALLEETGYPHLYRFWNYMADINGISYGLERYRQFNLGRQDALLACGRAAGDLPAACALGTAQGPLQIAFLAGRTPPLAIENPRQVSAYDYPEEYGPRSPAFSRATLLRLPHGEVLFVSGTASIVGHRTLHRGDAAAQTREALTNLETLFAAANRLSAGPGFDPARIVYRVYVRSAADLPSIRNEMERAFGPRLQAHFLQADICREDLLVEIETSAWQAFA